MREKLEELIKILTQGEKRKEVFEKIVKEKVTKDLKEFLEEIAFPEREAHCKMNGEVGNGFYSRNLHTLFGTLKGLRIPRTRRGKFKPCFIEPYRRVSFQLEELVIAMSERRLFYPRYIQNHGGPSGWKIFGLLGIEDYWCGSGEGRSLPEETI